MYANGMAPSCIVYASFNVGGAVLSAGCWVLERKKEKGGRGEGEGRGGGDLG